MQNAKHSSPLPVGCLGNPCTINTACEGWCYLFNCQPQLNTGARKNYNPRPLAPHRSEFVSCVSCLSNDCWLMCQEEWIPMSEQFAARLACHCFDQTHLVQFSSSPPLFPYVSSVNFLLVITSLTKRDQSINIAAPSPETKMKWPLMWPFEAPFTSLQSKRLISRGQKCTRTEALSPIVVVTYPSKNIQFFGFTCKSSNKFLIT